MKKRYVFTPDEMFPISRDPPEGGTTTKVLGLHERASRFQFLGIPPKGELDMWRNPQLPGVDSFQFLGIPPKGERASLPRRSGRTGCFQFLGIPPKGEPFPFKGGLKGF